MLASWFDAALLAVVSLVGVAAAEAEAAPETASCSASGERASKFSRGAGVGVEETLTGAGGGTSFGGRRNAALKSEKYSFNGTKPADNRTHNVCYI